jgi:hypothetical protein
MPRELETILESEAHKRGISVSALMSSLGMKFARWGRYAERYGTVCIWHDMLEMLIESIPEKTIAKVADDHGARIVIEALSFWFKDRSVNSLISFLEGQCSYGGYGHFEHSWKNQECEIRIQHSLGKNWSVFLAHCLRQVLRNIHVTAEFQTSETGIGVTIHTHP